MKLLPSQQAKVGEIVKEKGFDPRDFKWENYTQETLVPWLNKYVAEETSRIACAIRPEFYFVFSKYEIIYSPGEDEYEYRWKPRSRISFEENLQELLPWLDYLKREVDAPKWEDFFLPPKESLPEPSSNEPFTEPELVKIAAGLRQIEERLNQEFQLTDEQRRFVRERLEYLENAAQRAGRFDWGNIAAAVLINLVTTLASAFALDPAKAQALFNWMVVTLHSTGCYLLPGL